VHSQSIAKKNQQDSLMSLWNDLAQPDTIRLKLLVRLLRKASGLRIG
jgi:hypothetical protein